MEVSRSGCSALFVGFGRCGEAAARTLLRRREDPAAMLVLAATAEEHERAHSMGLTAMPLQAYRWDAEPAPGRAIIDLGALADALTTLRRLRASRADCDIAVAVNDPDQCERLLAAGASRVVCPETIAGISLAASVALVTRLRDRFH